jgi:hypothetical protein
MRDKFLLVLGLVVYIVLGVFAIQHHELWRDEMHSNMIAQASQSFSELLKNKDYEGHPPLWYVLLYHLKAISTDWRAMLWLNFGFATASVALILFASPFKTSEKLMMVLGYFFLYEYGTLARNYAIELFFLFSICAVFQYRHTLKGQILLGFLIGTLMQTNVFGFLIGFILGAFLAWEILLPQLLNKQYKPFFSVLFAAGVPIFVGITLATLSILPPEDGGIHRDHTSLMNVFRALGNIWSAYVPIPQFGLHFWNSNIVSFGNEFNGHVKTPLALLVLFIVNRLLRPYKTTRVLFCIGTIVFFVFTVSRYPGFLRHHGHWYIWFITCFWLKSYIEKGAVSETATIRLPDFLRLNFFKAILGAHIFAAAVALFYEMKYPFSQSKAVSVFLKENEHKYNRVVTYHDYSAEPYTAYLRKKVYHLTIQDSAFFVSFSNKRNEAFTATEIVKTVREQSPTDSAVLLVLNFSLDDSTYLPLKKVQSFEPAIVEDEQYYLYTLDPLKPIGMPFKVLKKKK